jgi:hypothetical protein
MEMKIMGRIIVLYEGTFIENELPRAVAGALGIESGDKYRFVTLDGNTFIEKVWN